jgi:flagellar biosynthetic protein FlhB
MSNDGPGGGEKTEKPTPQKIKQARKDGQIARTQELGTWLGAAAASVMLPRVAKSGFDSVQELFIQINAVAQNPELAAVAALFEQALTAFVVAVLPMGMVMLVVGSLASAGQGGVRWSNKPIKPTLKKLNPLPGFKRMFGPQGIWEAAKALIKTSVLIATLAYTSGTARELVMASGALPLSSVAATVTESAVLMLRVAAFTGLALAIADYLVVRAQMMKKLKMSKYEITQEHKRSEGDPYLKGRRRQIQLQMSGNRMMAEVTNADVMLVNPTHVAVALKYDPDSGAPKVIAKGAGEVAAKLRELAEESRVPMVQDIPLARALHASCDLGQEVPPQLFTAVARVLAFVMQLKARGVAAGVHRPGFPVPDTEGLPKAGRRR